MKRIAELNKTVKPTEAAFSLVEVMVAVFVLGTLVLALFGAFSSGVSVVQASRENMRATQILMQKLETIRLYTWSEGTNSTLAANNFHERYDPLSTNSGTVYAGVYSTDPAPSTIPAAYRSNMRLVTMTVYWTNNFGTPKARVQSRQIQSLVARYGMQNYVYQ
jgi:uncharacterized protein (TIGR02598 family)